jgi:tetratricopeptide (TPR) repeat protein
MHLRSIGLAAVLVLPMLPGSAAVAGVTVFGNGLAQICSDAAHQSAKDKMPDYKALQACDLALSDESLTQHDRAATFVNRGVLLLGRGSVTDAKRDFDTATLLMPEMGAAYTNRGAALIALRKYADGIVDIDRGLGLKAEEPEKAFYNRALADEALDDLKSAYFDYRQAAELKPDWDQPRIELARFTVSHE